MPQSMAAVKPKTYEDLLKTRESMKQFGLDDDNPLMQQLNFRIAGLGQVRDLKAQWKGSLLNSFGGSTASSAAGISAAGSSAAGASGALASL
jgi:hypothetical protein